MLIWDRTVFDTEDNWLSFWVDIMALVLSGNSVGADKELSLEEGYLHVQWKVMVL